MVKARCPSCGKSATFDESDAGLPVVCLACGGRYTAPDPFQAAAGGGGAAPPVSAATSAGRSRPGRTFWVAVCLGGLAAAAAVLLVVRGRPDPIDRATALALSSETQVHVANGRLADAHRKYHELETIVAGRTVRDPEARRVIDQAMSD